MKPAWHARPVYVAGIAITKWGHHPRGHHFLQRHRDLEAGVRVQCGVAAVLYRHEADVLLGGATVRHVLGRVDSVIGGMKVETEFELPGPERGGRDRATGILLYAQHEYDVMDAGGHMLERQSQCRG